MKKIIAVSVFVIGVLFVASSPVFARRVLPRAKFTSAAGSSIQTSTGPYTTVKFRPDRLGIDVTFANLSQAQSVSYLFSYNTRGTTQGAQGSVNPSENNTTREIIFGTCSHGVCRYDSGISGAKFVVTITLPDGRKIIKTYFLKV